MSYEQNFYRGEIIETTGDGMNFDVRLSTGPNEGEMVDITSSFVSESPELKVGEEVVVIETTLEGETSYALLDPFRLPSLFILFLIFFGFTWLIAGRRGFTALLGLIVSLLILVKGVIPSITSGVNPLMASFIGAVAIVLISLYLAHGFNKRTSLAVVSTLITLCFALVMAVAAVAATRLFGFGSEDAIYLSYGNFGGLDFKGLLLGAILIGTLGVLDDVTTAQTATIEELHKANPKLSSKELYKRGLSVGKEHITSLMNTLVLAYAGAAFPVIFLLSDATIPLWVNLNNEAMAEEIVRTLVGSTTLVLAVPIATLLAAKAYAKK